MTATPYRERHHHQLPRSARQASLLRNYRYVRSLNTGGLRPTSRQTAESSTAGRLFFQIIAAMAEFERSLIKDRTRAGLEAAEAQGRTGGRPTVVSDDVLTVARARRARGESVSAIAKALKISRATLYRHLEGQA
ncbi:recombinase family protein [Streptomyces sp. NBC_01142]|uniref:recombinase family protein n=1 Tax=Streptomyces sp. NBC_01142 TaxID=2975865 RepID=UPI002B1E8B26|nr:recombinase family protein [Streptomyces sp. NBC_01142]